MSIDLAALSDAWVKFLPRDAKSSSFTFVVASNGAPLPCKLEIAFHYYIEGGRSTYAGDSLHEVLRSFLDGSGPFPPHPGAVFEEGSLKVEKIAPGYPRADALAKLTSVLRAAFPAASALPAMSPPVRNPCANSKRETRTSATPETPARATAKTTTPARATAKRTTPTRSTAKTTTPARATAKRTTPARSTAATRSTRRAS